MLCGGNSVEIVIYWNNFIYILYIYIYIRRCGIRVRSWCSGSLLNWDVLVMSTWFNRRNYVEFPFRPYLKRVSCFSLKAFLESKLLERTATFLAVVGWLEFRSLSRYSWPYTFNDFFFFCHCWWVYQKYEKNLVKKFAFFTVNEKWMQNLSKSKRTRLH